MPPHWTKKREFDNFLDTKNVGFRLVLKNCHFFNDFFEEILHNVLISWKKYITIYEYGKNGLFSR